MTWVAAVLFGGSLVLGVLLRLERAARRRAESKYRVTRHELTAVQAFVSGLRRTIANKEHQVKALERLIAETPSDLLDHVFRVREDSGSED